MRKSSMTIRPGAADDVDQGVLRAALPGARRGRAGAAVRQVPVGRRQRRAAVQRTGGIDGGGGVLTVSRRFAEAFRQRFCEASLTTIEGVRRGGDDSDSPVA